MASSLPRSSCDRSPALIRGSLNVRVKATQSCGREAAVVKWRDGREAELGGEAGGGAGV